MKKLLTLFFVLVQSVLFAANGLIDASFVSANASRPNGYMLTVGDGIIDTPFSTSGGYDQIFITNIGTVFNGIRDGGTIWIDVDELNPLFNLYLSNGGSVWSASSTSTIRIMPLGGKLTTIETGSSNTSRTWLIADIKNLEINGFSETYPGMKWDIGTKKLRGNFGISIGPGTVLSQNPFKILIAGDAGMNGGSITLRHMEVWGGFTTLRLVSGNNNITLSKLDIQYCLLGPTLDGENGYFGQTTGTPYAKIANFIFKNNITFCAAADAMQIQHLVAAAEYTDVGNNTYYIGGFKWKDAFQDFQSGNGQIVADDGRIVIRNNIFDGAGYSGIQTISTAGTLSTSEPVIFDNNLINDVREVAIYMNSTMSHGVNWVFRNMYFLNANNTYNELSETTPVTSYVYKNGSDPVAFINPTWDNNKSSLFTSTTGLEIIGTTQDNTLDPPSYVRPCFPGKDANRIEYYSEQYPSWSVRTGDFVAYTAGDVVMRPIVGTGIRWYECSTNHTSSGSTHPESDPTKWDVITWDSLGTPSYDAGWLSGSAQDYDGCWYDYRQTSNSEWAIKHMGIPEERNTDRTTYQWYQNTSASDVGAHEAYGQNHPTKFFKYSEDLGLYVRLKCFLKTPAGDEIETWVNSWTLVN